jgi:hypothetical protein
MVKKQKRKQVYIKLSMSNKTALEWSVAKQFATGRFSYEQTSKHCFGKLSSTHWTVLHANIHGRIKHKKQMALTLLRADLLESNHQELFI